MTPEETPGGPSVAELQRAARELAHWRGMTDAKIDGLQAQVTEASTDISQTRHIVGEIRIDLAKVTTKVALITAGTSLAAGALVAVVVQLSGG